MLSERNEVHAQRVNIAPNGSFLVSMELQYRLEEQGYPYVLTDSGISFRIHHGDTMPEMIQQHLQAVENAILSADGIDSQTGKSWQELIDLDSWVKKYLLEEILGNYDAGSVSQYFYFSGENPEGKLYAGPIWDYDNTLGNYEWQTMNPQALLAGRPHITADTDTPWYYALYQKEAFSKRVKELYKTVARPRMDQLLDDLLIQQETLTSADQCNSLRWSRGDTAEKSTIMLTFLKDRMAFLDQIWIENREYHMVQVYNGVGSWGCFAVFPGECLPILPEYDDTVYSGWYQEGTGADFALTKPVEESLIIRVKPINKEPDLE